MSHKIAIVWVGHEDIDRTDYNCYNNDVNIIKSITDWQEVTNEDYNILKGNIAEIKSKLIPVMLEQDIEPLHNTIEKCLTYIKNEKKKRDQEEKKYKEENEKRQKTAEEKKKKKELKKLEELRKKYGE